MASTSNRAWSTSCFGREAGVPRLWPSQAGWEAGALGLPQLHLTWDTAMTQHISAVEPHLLGTPGPGRVTRPTSQ